MNLIVAVDKNWGIGCDGGLLFTIPEDMRYFKDMTLNKIVIMGRSTFNSLPNAKPLKDRVNIVLSKDTDLKIDGVTVCNSLRQLFETISGYNSDDIFVIGGQTIYEQLLNYCTFAYITKIDSIMDADKFFPQIEQMPHWTLAEQSDLKRFNDIEFRFAKYKNNTVAAF